MILKYSVLCFNLLTTKLTSYGKSVPGYVMIRLRATSCFLKRSLRPNKKNCLFSVHPSKFFQVGRAFFFVFFFSNEAYLVFIMQWSTSLHLHLSDYETTIPLFTMKPTTRKKKNVRKVWFSHAYNLISTMKNTVQFTVTELHQHVE